MTENEITSALLAIMDNSMLLTVLIYLLYKSEKRNDMLLALLVGRHQDAENNSIG